MIYLHCIYWYTYTRLYVSFSESSPVWYCFILVCTYTSYICTSEFSWWVLGKYCWRHKFLFTSISDHDVYWCRKGWIWRGQTILARHLNEKPEADTGHGDCWNCEIALHKSKFEIVSCPAPLQLLPIQTQCFNEIGGFIPNKKAHGPWVLSFGYLTPNEFQWGKSLGSPFNNPSCGRANGSLGVPEIAGVWLVLRDSIWKMLFFLDVCQWSFFLKFLPRFQIACCENPMSRSVFFPKEMQISINFPHPFCTSSINVTTKASLLVVYFHDIKGFHQKFPCKGELWLPKLQLLRCGAFFRREEWVSSCYDSKEKELFNRIWLCLEV